MKTMPRFTVLIMLAAFFALCFGLAPSAQGKLFVRFLFNEHQPGQDDPNGAIIANSGHYINLEAYDATVRRGDYIEDHATYVASPGGTALHLDGSLQQYILFHFPDVMGDTLPPLIVGDGMSIAYWLRFEANEEGYMSLVTTGDNNAIHNVVHHHLQYSTGGGVQTERHLQNDYSVPNGPQNPDTIVSANEWHHLVWTIEGDPATADSQTHKFYIDGELKATHENTTLHIGVSTATRFGATFRGGSYVEGFTGDLDQLEIYDHNLDGTEVTELYEAGAFNRINGQDWIRTNPVLIGGQLISSDPCQHAVDTAGEIEDFFDAGFTYLGVFDPSDRGSLDLAQSVNPDSPVYIWSGHDNNLRQFRNDYGAAFPVIVQRGDEPYWPVDLERYATQVKFLKSHYPEYLIFTNANGVTDNHPLDDPTYFQRFVDTIGPDVLMSDRYPLYTNGTTDFGYYFDMLAEMRKVALVNNLPLWVWVQSETKVPEYVAINGRLPSETDLRMMIFSAMSFGFTGFNYLSYAHWIVDAVLDPDGNQTHVYQSAVNTNPEVKTLLEVMRFATSTGVFYVPGQPGNTVPEYHEPIDLDVWSAGADPDSHIQDVSIDENGTLINGLIGFFTADDHEDYFMICNLFSGPGLTPVDAEVTFRVQFDASVGSLLQLNRLTGAQEVVTLTSNELVDVLPGGTANLYKYNNGQGFQTEWLGPAPESCQDAIDQGYGLGMDLNADCKVDMIDVSMFVQQWLVCIEPGDSLCGHPWSP